MENKKEEFAIAMKCPYEIVENFLLDGVTPEEITKRIVTTMSKDLEKFITSYVEYVKAHTPGVSYIKNNIERKD